jgi:hypothetical protein
MPLVPSVSWYYTYRKMSYKIRAFFWHFCNNEQFLANHNIFLLPFAQIVIASLVPNQATKPYTAPALFGRRESTFQNLNTEFMWP